MPRTKFDLIAHMLKTARNGTTGEKIAVQTKLHQELVADSISLLTDLNLLTEKHNSPTSLVTTPRGLKFLRDYQKLTEKLASEQARNAPLAQNP